MKKYIIPAVITIIACAGIGVGLAIALRGNGDNGTSSEGGEDNVVISNTLEDINSEETAKTTEETINKYADVTIEGYQNVNNDSFSGDAVVVTVRNSSEETVSLAITIGAYDSEGNLLDTSSLYAEGIMPNQTNTFNTFVYTELTPDQMRAATFKVIKALTYEANHGDTEETVTEVEEPSIIEEAAGSTEETVEPTKEATIEE